MFFLIFLKTACLRVADYCWESESVPGSGASVRERTHARRTTELCSLGVAEFMLAGDSEQNNGHQW